eukprot:jgi/Mesvir1/4369/Mv02447-RA.2
MENLHSAVGITLGNVAGGGTSASNQSSASGDISGSTTGRSDPQDRNRPLQGGRQASGRSLAPGPSHEDRDADGIKSDSDMPEPRAVPTPMPRGVDDRRNLNWAGDPVTNRQYSTSAPARDPLAKPSGGGWWRSQRPQRISVDGEEAEGEGGGDLGPGQVSAPVTGCRSNRNSADVVGPSPRLSPPQSPFPGFDANSVPGSSRDVSGGPGAESGQGGAGASTQDKGRQRLPSLDEGMGGSGRVAEGRGEAGRAAPASVAAEKKKVRAAARAQEPPRRLFVWPTPTNADGSYSVGDNPDLPWKPRCPAEAPYERELRSHMLSIGRMPERYLHKRPAHLVAMMPAENNMRTAGAVLRVDRNLRAIRFRYVPKRMSEERFWQRYFTALAIIRHDVMEVHLPGHEPEFCDLCLMLAAQQVSAAAAALAAKEQETDAPNAHTPKGQAGEGDSDEDGMPHADEYVQVMLAPDEDSGAVSLQLEVVMVMVEGSHGAHAGGSSSSAANTNTNNNNHGGENNGENNKHNDYSNAENGATATATKGGEPSLTRRKSVEVSVVAEIAAAVGLVDVDGMVDGRAVDGRAEGEARRRSQDGVAPETLAAATGSNVPASMSGPANADASGGGADAAASLSSRDSGATAAAAAAAAAAVAPDVQARLPSLRVSVSNALTSSSSSTGRNNRASVSGRHRDVEGPSQSQPARAKPTRRSSRIDPAAAAGGGAPGGSGGGGAGTASVPPSERLQPSMILQRLASALELARSTRSMAHLLAQPLDAPPGGPGPGADGGRGSGTGPLGLGIGSSLTRAVEAALGPFRVAKEAKLAEIEGAICLAVWDLFDTISAAAAEGAAGPGAGAGDAKPAGQPELTHRKSQELPRDAAPPTSPPPPVLVAERVNGAPVDGLVAHLAVAMARLTNVAQMARMWDEVVKELRWHWDMGKPLPRVPTDEAPDLRYCLLHQQLMLINACVARRHRRAKALAQLEAARRTARASADMDREGLRLASASATPSATGGVATPFAAADGALGGANIRQGGAAPFEAADAPLIALEDADSTVPADSATGPGRAAAATAGTAVTWGSADSAVSDSDLISMGTAGDGTPSTAASSSGYAQANAFPPAKSVSEPLACLMADPTVPSPASSERAAVASSGPSAGSPSSRPASNSPKQLQASASEPLIPLAQGPPGVDHALGAAQLMLDASVMGGGGGGGPEEDSVRSANMIALTSPVGPPGGLVAESRVGLSASDGLWGASFGLGGSGTYGLDAAPWTGLAPSSLMEDPTVVVASSVASLTPAGAPTAPASGDPLGLTAGIASTTGAHDAATEANSPSEARSTANVFFSLEDGELQRQTVAFDPLEDLMPVNLLSTNPLAPAPAALATGQVATSGLDLMDASVHVPGGDAAENGAAAVPAIPATVTSTSMGAVEAATRPALSHEPAGSGEPAGSEMTAENEAAGHGAAASDGKMGGGGGAGGAPVFAGSGLPLRGVMSFEEDSQREPEGVVGLVKDLVLLKTGVPMNKPETQECAILTEEMMRETEEMLMRTGSVGPGCKQLLADMEAFKAANPGCVLEDFVRWYSPPDWIEDPSPRATTDDGVMGGCRHGAQAQGSEPACSCTMETHAQAGVMGGQASPAGAPLLADITALPVEAPLAPSPSGDSVQMVASSSQAASSPAAPSQAGPVSLRLDMVLPAATGSDASTSSAEAAPDAGVASLGDNRGVATDATGGATAAPAVKLPRGRLSARMQEQDNLWCQLWDSAQPIPAYKQSPLFDAEHAGESTITLLENIAPSDLFEQLFFTALGCAFTAASTTLLSIVESEKQRSAPRRRTAISDDPSEATPGPSASGHDASPAEGAAATSSPYVASTSAAAPPSLSLGPSGETPKSPLKPKQASVTAGSGGGGASVSAQAPAAGRSGTLGHHHQQSSSGLVALKDLLRDACAYAEVSCVRGMGAGKIDSLCQVRWINGHVVDSSGK